MEGEGERKGFSYLNSKYLESRSANSRRLEVKATSGIRPSASRDLVEQRGSIETLSLSHLREKEPRALIDRDYAHLVSSIFVLEKHRHGEIAFTGSFGLFLSPVFCLEDLLRICAVANLQSACTR